MATYDKLQACTTYHRRRSAALSIQTSGRALCRQHAEDSCICLTRTCSKPVSEGWLEWAEWRPTLKLEGVGANSDTLFKSSLSLLARLDPLAKEWRRLLAAAASPRALKGPSCLLLICRLGLTGPSVKGSCSAGLPMVVACTGARALGYKGVQPPVQELTAVALVDPMVVACLKSMQSQGLSTPEGLGACHAGLSFQREACTHCRLHGLGTCSSTA